MSISILGPCYDENGDQYPLTTRVKCENDELLCPGDSPGNGCPGQDVCIQLGKDKFGNLCQGTCPHKCHDDEIRCQIPPDPISGCLHPPLCIPKWTDFLGNICPIQQCPQICTEEEFFCPGKIIELGCKEEDLCNPRGTSKEGELCPGKCPVKCNSETQIKCEGQLEPSGCIGPDVCHAKARDVNGEYCPDDSDSHGCLVVCKENEILCPAKMDILGCKESAKCFPKETDIPIH